MFLRATILKSEDYARLARVNQVIDSPFIEDSSFHPSFVHRSIHTFGGIAGCGPTRG